MKRFVWLTLAWLLAASAFVLVPASAASADTWLADWNAVFAPQRGEAFSAVRAPVNVSGISPRGGVNGLRGVGAVQAESAKSTGAWGGGFASAAAQLIDTSACDANADGIYEGVASEDQSHGADIIADMWNEDRGYVSPLPVTEPGYRVNVYVCREWVDGTLEFWIYPRDPYEPGTYDTRPQITLVDGAQGMQEQARDDVIQTLEANFYQPGWEIWPGHRSRQIVGLPSWLYITDEAWDYRPSANAQRPSSSGGGDHYEWFEYGWQIQYFADEVAVSGISMPVGSVWRFSDGEELTCEGRGQPWTPGAEPPDGHSHGDPLSFCHRDWEHTYDFDDMELEVALQYVVRWESSLAGSSGLIDAFSDDAPGGAVDPWRAIANAGLGATSGQLSYEGPFNDAVELRVGEVQAYGSTVGARQQSPPPESWAILGQLHEPCGGFWGSIGCALGNVTRIFDAVASAIIPGYEQIKDFLSGCAQGGAALVGQFKESVLAAIEAARNPIAAAGEAWEGIQTMLSAVMADPVGAALEMLGQELDLETLRSEGIAVWAGKLVCEKGIEFVVGYVTGSAAAGLAKRVKDFIDRVRRGDTSPRPDIPNRPNDPGPNPGNPNDPGGNNPNNPNNPGGNNPNDPNDPGGNNPNDPNDPNNGPACPRGLSSFPAGTLVLMADHTHTPIEQIRPGDHVISHNLITGAWEPKLVVDQWSHPDRGPPATATLTDGSTITATDDHLFWVESTQAWTELQHVQPGDGLLTPDGVVGVDHVTVGPAHPWTVWELTVTDNHNFTVATDTSDVLVHNVPMDACDVDAAVAEKLLDEYGIDLDNPNLSGDFSELEELVSRARSAGGDGPGARFQLDNIKRYLDEGNTVELIAPQDGDGLKWPDYRVNGKLADVKSIDASSANGIRNGIRDANQQVGGYQDRIPDELGTAEIQIRGDLSRALDVDLKVRDRLRQSGNLDQVKIFDEAGDLVGEWIKNADGTIVGGLQP